MPSKPDPKILAEAIEMYKGNQPIARCALLLKDYMPYREACEAIREGAGEVAVNPPPSSPESLDKAVASVMAFDEATAAFLQALKTEGVKLRVGSAECQPALMVAFLLNMTSFLHYCARCNINPSRLMPSYIQEMATAENLEGKGDIDCERLTKLIEGLPTLTDDLLNLV